MPTKADQQVWYKEAMKLRAAKPEHVLFLCVANSARSQLAESIARSLAPSTVRISSAGSSPESLRTQAVEVMQEIGFDISEYRSKSVDEVERPVDLVITLCAEEACPVWLEEAVRLHWPIPDPAMVGGSRKEQMDAFRGARDELSRRLSVLFGV